jgi:hypothetical protein
MRSSRRRKDLWEICLEYRGRSEVAEFSKKTTAHSLPTQRKQVDEKLASLDGKGGKGNEGARGISLRDAPFLSMAISPLKATI